MLVTGAAGFIGASVTHSLLDRGESVIDLDNLGQYQPEGGKTASSLKVR